MLIAISTVGVGWLLAIALWRHSVALRGLTIALWWLLAIALWRHSVALRGLTVALWLCLAIALWRHSVALRGLTVALRWCLAILGLSVALRKLSLWLLSPLLLWLLSNTSRHSLRWHDRLLLWLLLG